MPSVSIVRSFLFSGHVPLIGIHHNAFTHSPVEDTCIISSGHLLKIVCTCKEEYFLPTPGTL